MPPTLKKFFPLLIAFFYSHGIENGKWKWNKTYFPPGVSPYLISVVIHMVHYYFIMILLLFSFFRWINWGFKASETLSCEISCSHHFLCKIAHTDSEPKWLVVVFSVSLYCIQNSFPHPGKIYAPYISKTSSPHIPPFWNTHVPLQSTTIWKSHPFLNPLSSPFVNFVKLPFLDSGCIIKIIGPRLIEQMQNCIAWLCHF